MRRTLRVAVSAVFLVTTVAFAEPPPRNRATERVSVSFAAGYLDPSGRFEERAEGGLLTAFGGYFAATDYVAPAFSVQYAFLEPDFDQAGLRGSLDTWQLLCGVRVFVAPPSLPVRPWLTALGGWAHYDSYRPMTLEPLFGTGRSNRDDAMLSIGGGAEFRLHPNFSLALDVRENVSFTDDREVGERDLEAVSILGVLDFHY